MPAFSPVRLLTLFCICLAASQAMAYEVAGLVLDAEGAPVSGADVWLNQQRNARVTTSDKEGRFAFTDLLAAPVDIIARKEGLALGGVQGQIIRDIEVTVVLKKPDSIKLQILSPEYKPVAGARLKRLALQGSFTAEMEDLVPLGFPSLRSGEDGTLTIDGLPLGVFISVTVSHRDYADTTLPALPAGIEIAMPMPPALKLRGRVTNGAGEGVERVRISAYESIEGVEHELTEVLSDPEGFYTANVPRGNFFVAARHLDYAMPEPLPVELDGSADETILDITLPAAHRIEGTTVDTEGNPVSMTKLSYYVGGIIYNEAVSDIAGAFQLTVASGSGELHVMPPARMMTIGYPRIFFRVEDEPIIRIGPIELQALPLLSGRITAEDGVGLDKILISSLNLDPPAWAVTNEEGTFEIELERMYEGPMRFRAEHAVRFLRRDFSVDPIALRSPEVQLRSFKPDLDFEGISNPNNLEHMLDKPAPEIECDAWLNLDTADATLSLEELRGKVVVLTLWGGFDTMGTTRHRINELNAMYELLRGLDDVAIIAVHDASIEPVAVARYVYAYGIQFPVGCDADPFLTFDIYNTNTIPQTVLIDKEGILRHYKVDGRILELIKDLRRR